ncbi:MAG: twin-arginine translocase TatA/TatE family subunit [Actinomycetota bacterium]|nr:twin-arginine translocase TatA/TatE family subunit [Actinomycetota bacterium]
MGFGEILVILVLALVIFGPKRLPEMGRTIGRSLKEFRRAATDLRSEFEVDLEEPPRASVEERARRLRERKQEAAPPRGEAPPA